MAENYDLHQLYRALAWGQVRSGDLDNALGYVLRIIKETPENEDEYIFALGIAGAIYEGRGETDEALSFGERCLSKAAEKFQQQPDDDNVILMICACVSLSRLYQKLSRIEDALRLYSVMYTAAVDALSISPGEPLFLKLKMLACESIADLYTRQDLPSQAYPFCQEYETCCLALIETDPDDLDAKNKLNMSRILLGDYYLKSEDEETALSYYRQAEQDAAAVSSQHLSSAVLAGYADLRSTHALACEKLSNVYEKLTQLEQANTYSLINERILRSLIDDHPENLIFQYNLSSCLQHTGFIRYAQQNFADALAYFEQCFTLTTKLIHQVPDMTDLKRMIAIIYQYRAMIYEDMGEPEPAATNYRAMYNTLRDLTKLYPDDPIMRDNFAYACLRYGFFCYEAYNDHLSAEKYLQEGLKLYEQLSREFPDVPEYLEKIDMTHSGLEELKNGRPL